MMTQFLGREGLQFWIGVVEDIQDPLQMGRARVRVFGQHTDNLDQLPTSGLPWAIPIMPFSQTQPTPPKLTDWVLGFCLDGAQGQQPVMLGVLPGNRVRDPEKLYDQFRRKS